MFPHKASDFFHLETSILLSAACCQAHLQGERNVSSSVAMFERKESSSSSKSVKFSRQTCLRRSWCSEVKNLGTNRLQSFRTPISLKREWLEPMLTLIAIARFFTVIRCSSFTNFSSLDSFQSCRFLKTGDFSLSKTGDFSSEFIDPTMDFGFRWWFTAVGFVKHFLNAVRWCVPEYKKFYDWAIFNKI